MGAARRADGRARRRSRAASHDGPGPFRIEAPRLSLFSANISFLKSFVGDSQTSESDFNWPRVRVKKKTRNRSCPTQVSHHGATARRLLSKGRCESVRKGCCARPLDSDHASVGITTTRPVNTFVRSFSRWTKVRIEAKASARILGFPASPLDSDLAMTHTRDSSRVLCDFKKHHRSSFVGDDRSGTRYLKKTRSSPVRRRTPRRRQDGRARSPRRALSLSDE